MSGETQIAEAIDRLAMAQQAEADATAALVMIHKEAYEASRTAAAERVASDVASRETVERYIAELGNIRPALELLNTIAKAMRGER